MITAQNLSKKYKKQLAVNDLSFTVETGKVTSFLGPNGAGKSTTMRLMLGLDNGAGSIMFDAWSLVWRCMFCGWGYAMYAFILLMIMRNQVGAIVTYLLVPLIGENILALLLKENAKNLPFTALQSVAAPTGLGNHASAVHQALLVVAYVAGGLIVSLVLFQRRDAN